MDQYEFARLLISIGVQHQNYLKTSKPFHKNKIPVCVEILWQSQRVRVTKGNSLETLYVTV